MVEKLIAVVKYSICCDISCLSKMFSVEVKIFV